jgi:hypothetical protein
VDAEWFYIGHYGQLGPLTREQFDELIEGGVVGRETYVWKAGMADWAPAEKVPGLADSFQKADPFLSPPPMPQGPPPPSRGVTGMIGTPAPPYQLVNPPYQPNVPFTAPPPAPTTPVPYNPSPYAIQQPGVMSTLYSSGIRSDKSRSLAGILNILIPGIGRMYLGYSAIGALQLILTICSGGALWIWSIIDGVYILCGGAKTDGYGRILSD